jgi:DUF971 family protein
MGDRAQVERLKQVGRYALGVEWGDGHESILPHASIRRCCPCDACADLDPAAPLPNAADQPVRLEMLGDASLFITWADTHETVLLTDELRALCRCAHCAGEPQYPISGR